MSRQTLPKAYLRLDPNIDRAKGDTRWDFIRLLCEANRQPRRGRFKNRALFDRTFGRSSARRLIEAGDAVERASGEVVVPGWDEWQEGDITVAERQRRIRFQRDSSVTAPLHDRIPPPPSSSTRSSTDRALGRGASANGADMSPIEIELQRLMAPRHATPNQVDAVENFHDQLGDELTRAVIGTLADERPERDVFGTLLKRLKDQVDAARPSRNGRIGPKRNPLNDYDALAESGS